METTTKTLWKIDTTHSEITFKVKHMMISSVTGHFENFEATAHTDTDDFVNADISVAIQSNSINTKNKDRDAHLKSGDFFAAEQYPDITFVSKSFDGQKLVGDLTIKDVTKELTLYVDFNGIAQDPYGQTKAGFEITGNINRQDFGLTWSAVTEAGKIVVGDSVKLSIEAQLVKQ